MEAVIRNSIAESIATKQRLFAECVEDIQRTASLLIRTLRHEGMILLCGNGGSAADAQHIATELVVRYRSAVERRALPALALTTDTSLLTAASNDYAFEEVFARQVQAFGNPLHCLVCISTSGRSENVRRAAEEAKAADMAVVGLLGGDGGTIAPLCDAAVIVPSAVTARIQEAHILIGHIWCELIEQALFGVQQ